MSIARMAHRNDPETSHAAAWRAIRGTKKGAIQGQILALLSEGPLTAKELHHHYETTRKLGLVVLPPADLMDIRRRLTELKLDHQSVEDSGLRRNGEAVMRLSGVS